MFHNNWKYGVFSAGFTGIAGQILLLRQFENLYGGSEIGIGVFFLVWLTAGGIGAGSARAVRNPAVFKFMLIAQVVVLAVILFLFRLPEVFWHPGRGILPGFHHAMIGGLIILPFSLVTGLLFTLGVGLSKTFGGRVYFYESIGAAAGGVLTAVLLGKISSFHFVFILLALNAIFLTRNHYSRILILAASMIALLFAAPVMNELSLRNYWPGHQMVGFSESRYAEIQVLRSGGQYSVFHNGVLSVSVPDLMSAEESVHFPLLLHPEPKSALLIGGGFGGAADEIFKHRSIEKIGYCEIDGEMTAFLTRCLPAETANFIDDPRVSLISKDGREYLKKCKLKYDLIITALPDPVNGQLNRYYTAEFYCQVKHSLNDGGLFAFSLKSSETYISGETAEVLAGMKRTMETVFPEVLLIPGERCHFIGFTSEGASDTKTILKRLGQRKIDTVFLSPYYLPDRLSDENFDYLSARIESAEGAWINRDFFPAGFISVLIRDEKRFHPRRAVLTNILKVSEPGWILSLPVVLLILSFLIAGGDRISKGVKTAVAMGGMSQMGIQLMLIWGFQSVFGYVYYQQAILITAFMAGGAAGAFWVHRQPDFTARISGRNFIFIQAGITALPITAFVVLSLAKSGGSPVAYLLTLTALVSGIAGGMHYSAGAKLLKGHYQQAGGGLYAFDLIGAALGSIAVTLLMIPVFGFFRTSLILTGFGIVPLVYLVVTIIPVIKASGEDT
ncbi:MAG: hypothetical protein H8E46_08050 [FCB group bacterium]|nr:hypothetical protein [FCB group bacterium]